MAETVSKIDSPTSDVPLFRCSHTVFVDDVENKLSEGTLIKSEFFCARDPQKAVFQLRLRGRENGTKFSIHLVSVDRDVNFKLMNFRFYNAHGDFIGTVASRAGRIFKKGQAAGFNDTSKIDDSKGTDSWKVLLEFEYYGVASTPSRQPAVAPSQFQRDFLKLFETGDQADVSFNVQGEVIPAHKVILTTRCEYFQAMFNSGLEESESKEITVPDIDPKVFKALLYHIYSDIKPKFVGESTMALLSAADKYGVNHLKNQCENLLCDYLNANNIIEILLLAETHHCSKLMERAKSVFAIHVEVLKSQKKWKKLTASPSLLLQLLECAHDQ